MASVCSTCLSLDRKVKPLKMIAQMETLHLLKLELLVTKSNLCWECEADLIRADRFRQRAKQAQSILKLAQRKSTKQYHLQWTSLSTLTAVKLGPEHYTYTYDGDVAEKSHIDKHNVVKKDMDGWISIDVPVKQEKGSKVLKSIKTEEEDDSELPEEWLDISGDSNSDSNSYSDNDSLILQQPTRYYEICQKKYIVTRVKKGSVKCVECGKSFVSHSKLRRHMKTHLDTDERLQQCPHCDKKPINLDYHIATAHTRKLESYCAECDQQFATVSAYRNHLQTTLTHNPNAPRNPVTCVPCNKQFLRVNSYQKHLRTHPAHNPDARRFECKHCLKRFHTQTQVRQHVDIVHELKKPFVCELCGYATSTIRNLRVHTKFKHQHFRRPERSKDHICQYCAKQFDSSSKLVRHVRTHTGEKPYQCAHCDWRFSQRGPLVTHLRGKHRELGVPVPPSDRNRPSK